MQRFSNRITQFKFLHFPTLSYFSTHSPRFLFRGTRIVTSTHPKGILLIALHTHTYIWWEELSRFFPHRGSSTCQPGLNEEFHVPPKSLLPPTRGKFITEKRGEGRSPDRFWPPFGSAPPRRPSLVRTSVVLPPEKEGGGGTVGYV